MTIEIGALLYHRYRIQKVIAHGGMGAIYRGLDESLGVEVAVKENLIANVEYSRQFHREATILASLRHPNLPRVTDHFVIENQGQYLVMDFIDGEDLRQRMSRAGGINGTEALLIGIAICNALDYLHTRQPAILHRDIKPGNIKLTPHGQIFLVDFGLAKIVQSGQATTIGAQSLTPGYAPPEQYGQGTDARSDIYSLAATLYAALSNVLPEDGLSRAMGSAILTPLRQRNHSIQERLAAVIERGMAVDPQARYQTASDFKLALMGSNTQIREKIEGVEEIRVDMATPILLDAGKKHTVAAGAHPAVASQPPVQQDPERPASSPLAAAQKKPISKFLLPVGGAILFLALVIGGFALLPGLSSNKKNNLLPEAIQTATQLSLTSDSNQPVVAPKLTSTPVIPTEPVPTKSSPSTAAAIPKATETIYATPLGRDVGEIAFASNRSGTFQIYVMGGDGKDIRRVTNLSDGACQPDWSPDGKQLVFISPCAKDQEQYKGSGLFLINADGSGVIPLRTTPGGDYEPAWSPDGQSIAFTTVRDGRPHIYLYHLSDQTSTNLSKLSSIDHQPAWSPDGNFLAFTSLRSDRYQIYIMAKDGSKSREFSNPADGPAQYPFWALNGEVILFSRGVSRSILIAKRIDDRINEFPVSNTIRPVWDASYSPDENWLLFVSTMDGNQEIYRMTKNGTRVVRLSEDPGVDIDPVWKPK